MLVVPFLGQKKDHEHAAQRKPGFFCTCNPVVSEAFNLQRPKPFVRLLPLLDILRLERLQVARPAHDIANFRKCRDVAAGPSLNQHVAQRRRFDGSGDHGSAARIRGKLVEHHVLAAAPHDVDHFNSLTGQLFNPFQHLAILQREAFQRSRRTALPIPEPVVRSAGTIDSVPSACPAD